MEKTKKKITISPRLFSIFIAIFLCLLSVCLIVDILAPIRALTFCFNFSFGLGAYFFYALLYAFGVYLLFLKDKFKLHFEQFIGYFLIAISVCSISSTFSNNIYVNSDMSINLFIERFNAAFFNESKNYFTSNDFIFLALNNSNYNNFSFGGGFVGCFFNQLLGNNGLSIWLIFSFIFLLGIVLIPFRFVFNLIKNKLLISSKSKNEINKKPIKDNEPIEFFQSSNNNLSNEAIQKTISSENKSEIQEINPSNYKSNIISSNPIINENGLFVPAKFKRNQNANLSDMNFSEVSMKKPVEQKTNNEMVPDFEASVPEYDPRVEQLEIPFDEPINNNENIKQQNNEIDMTLATKQPQFNEPQPIQSQVVKEKLAPKKKIKWVPPSTDLLTVYDTTDATKFNVATAEERKKLIDEIFVNFRIKAHVEDYVIGPSVTRYNVAYDGGESQKAIGKYIDDIGIRAGGVSVRFERIVQGSFCSGLEIANAKITTVGFKEVFEQMPDPKKHPLAIAFGKNIEGKIVYADLNEFPHGLIAGTTGSGKSVFVNSIIVSLIMRNSPDDLKMILVDPKRIEMGKYQGMPHLLCDVITEPSQANVMMNKLVELMEERYRIFQVCENQTNIKEYNEYAAQKGIDKMPYVVAILDEYGDLVQNSKDIAIPVVKIGQKARAAGIHLLIATQRPSTDVINGTIKANLPTHIALTCASATDSKTVLNHGGAEKLLGKGDMLVDSSLLSRGIPVRIQSPYIDKGEIINVVTDLKNKYETVYDPKFTDLIEKSEAAADEDIANGNYEAEKDEFEEMQYQEIKEWVMCSAYMSMSRIQCDRRIGFNKARRYFNRLQAEGIVGRVPEGNKGCPVLVRDDSNNDAPIGSDELTNR